MTSDKDGNYTAAYTYGLDRISVDNLASDETIKQTWGSLLSGGTSSSSSSSSSSLPSEILRKGSRGSAVQKLQQSLIDLGYNLGSYGADGAFGNKTEQAVLKFQRDHGLLVDGIVGSQTWGALQGILPPSDRSRRDRCAGTDYIDGQWTSNDSNNNESYTLTDYLSTIMKDIKHNTRDFAGGIAMGIDQGAYWGIPHSIVEYITGKRVDRDSTAYWAGTVIGDIASMIQGVYTIAAGLGEELVGGGLDLTIGGALLGGLALNAAGVLTITYGGTVVACSAASMSSDLNMLFSKVQDGFGNNGGSKGNIPVKDKTTASNGLNYQSNPKHTPGQPGNRPNAGIEPKNSLDLFGESIPSPDSLTERFAFDKETNTLHRFFEDGNGIWHWSGSTNQGANSLRGRDVPNDIKNIFNLPKKGW